LLKSLTVSVVIPAYNSARYISTAVESALAQSLRDCEIIVIDDGSTDHTREIIARFGSSVRYVAQRNAGVAVARSRGIQESQGHYIGFLDADDTWLPTKLERQVMALSQSPARACYTAYTICDRALRPLAVQRSLRHGPMLDDLLLRGNVVGNICSVLCDRALFSMVGGFDPILSQCADWDMWIRLATVTDFLYLDEPLVNYRQHGSSMSRRPELLERDSLRVLEKGFSLPGVPAAVRERRREAFGRNYMVLAGTYFHARRYRDFLRCVFRALPMDPWQLTYLASFPGRLIRRGLTRTRPVGQWR
jgi:glycosyltransferase involved in cell wall biosynthesis